MAMLKMTFLLHYVTYKNPIFLSHILSRSIPSVSHNTSTACTLNYRFADRSPIPLFCLLIDLQCPWFAARSPMPLTVMPQISRRPMSVLPPLSQPSPSLAWHVLLHSYFVLPPWVGGRIKIPILLNDRQINILKLFCLSSHSRLLLSTLFPFSLVSLLEHQYLCPRKILTFLLHYVT